MAYTKTYNDFKPLYNMNEKKISLPGTGVKIFNIDFTSDMPSDEFFNKSDYRITENRSFVYPVFAPADTTSKRVILFLHGLNERSWIKYLVWAYYLSEQTGSYVILFPISFHINRSPSSWSDPRKMISVMKERNSALGEADMLSFANVALSNRLTEDPMRFFNSGYETTSDLIKLLTSVRNGEHSIIPKTDKINVFAYSIGAFLAEILMMGNPGNLFSESKLFMFCGGSVFSSMRGSSRLIMDTHAFNRVYNFYLFDFEKKLTGKSQFVEFMNSSRIGMAFRAMIDLGRFREFRENVLRHVRERIHSIALLKDTVIPTKGIISTLRSDEKKDIVDVLDFPYNYTHENPFPVLDLPLSAKVDYWFETVFSEAALYLQ